MSFADAPALDLLKVMEKFAISHAQSLGQMREALSDTISEAWDAENNVITIKMVGCDDAPINCQWSLLNSNPTTGLMSEK